MHSSCFITSSVSSVVMITDQHACCGQLDSAYRGMPRWSGAAVLGLQYTPRRHITHLHTAQCTLHTAHEVGMCDAEDCGLTATSLQLSTELGRHLPRHWLMALPPPPPPPPPCRRRRRHHHHRRRCRPVMLPATDPITQPPPPRCRPSPSPRPRSSVEAPSASQAILLAGWCYYPSTTILPFRSAGRGPFSPFSARYRSGFGVPELPLSLLYRSKPVTQSLFLYQVPGPCPVPAPVSLLHVFIAVPLYIHTYIDECISKSLIIHYRASLLM